MRQSEQNLNINIEVCLSPDSFGPRFAKKNSGNTLKRYARKRGRIKRFNVNHHNKIDVEQEDMPSIEVVDYGLHSVLMSPRKGSLAEKIKWLQEQGHTEFYEEKSDGLLINIFKMTRFLSQERTIHARHMVLALKRKHSIEVEQGIGLIPYDQLNVIKHEDGR